MDGLQFLSRTKGLVQEAEELSTTTATMTTIPAETSAKKSLSLNTSMMSKTTKISPNETIRIM